MINFVDRFKELVALQGDKTALVFGQKALSYLELDEYTNTIAAYLVHKGVKVETVIPVLLPRGIDYIAAELGILKAGAALSPLSTEYPADRVEYIRRDCKAPFVFTEEFLEACKQSQLDFTPLPIGDLDAAIVIYTSGSTGNPKGIVHDHQSFADTLQSELSITCKPQGIELSVSPFSFAIQSMDIFAPLWAGASIHILDEQQRKDIAFIEAYIEEHGITAMAVSPQLLKRLPDKPSTLERICCGGERLSQVYHTNETIINSYGLAEVLCAVISYEVDKFYDNTPIGKPLEGFSVYLLDEEGREVPAGAEGEICISGRMARGYLNLPEQTAKVFVANPFRSRDGQSRLFKTGDIGIKNAEGELVYVNRKDWMVKINGNRVETGEVETLMAKVPGIEQAVVKAFEDEGGQTYLCGFYTSKVLTSLPEKGSDKLDSRFRGNDLGETLESEARHFVEASHEQQGAIIRSFLATKTPDYMIPRFLVALDAFPLNTNGKLDRKALQAPSASRYKKGYVAPETPLQQQLCEAFAVILGVEGIGINDDFFSLGGDSVKVIMLQEQLSSHALEASLVFTGKTPRGIAQLLEQEREQAGTGNAQLPYDFSEGVITEAALTDSQLGIFVECARDPQSLMYNNAVGIALDATIDLDRIKEALLQAIKSTPALNVSIARSDGQFVMVLDENMRHAIELIPDEGRSAMELIQDFARPFDLYEGPLCRFALAHTSDGPFLLGDMHHIIADGTSTMLFYQKLSALYEGEPTEEVTRNELSFLAAAHAEHQMRQSGQTRPHQDYFEALLEGVEVQSAPLNDDSADIAKDEKGCRRVVIPYTPKEGAEKAIEQLGRMGVTEGSLFLGAYTYFLAKATGQEETLLYLAENGRHDPRLRTSLGMYVKTLPFYTAIDENETTAAYLRRIQAQQFDEISHDSVSFVDLAAKFSLQSDVLFVYQGEMLQPVTIAGVACPMTFAPHSDSMATLSLSVSKTGFAYELSFEYRGDLYREETIRAYGAIITRILDGLFEAPTLSAIELATPEELERYQLFDRARAEDYDRTQTIVDLFKKTVQSYPDYKAVCCNGTTLTYRELDEQSDALAHMLIKKGAGREIPIGVLVGRNERYVVYCLGVLKAGSATQPLDPGYPDERIEYMLSDSAAPLVIADPELAPRLSAYYAGTIITTDTLSALEAGAPFEQTIPTANSLLTLLYTSGTTGKPKGVMLEHQNLVEYLTGFHRRFASQAGDHVSAYASFGFDASVMEVFAPLTCGECLCIIPEDMRLDLPKIHDFIVENYIVRAFFTTQVARQFTVMFPTAPLTWVITGGETLIPLEPPSFTLVNLYGPTENTVHITDYAVDRLYDNIPIGRPLSDTALSIVDGCGRALPALLPGELCVAGRQVARGYLNLPEKTAEVFTENPYFDDPAFSRLYRTGDVCRRLLAGNMQYIGRSDFQVKINGFRVELGEIEHRVREYHTVTDATAQSFDLPTGGKAVAAYVVTSEPLESEELKSFLSSRLPYYMVPAVIITLDVIPLNVNGKVDKRKLPNPTQAVSVEPTANSEGASTGTRKPNRLEAALVALVEETLGFSQISLDRELLSLGLSSLSAIVLAARIKDVFGQEIEVSTLLDGRASVLSIEDKLLERFLAETPTLEDAPKESVRQAGDAALPPRVPLTASQLGVYYDTIKQPDTILYNIPMLFSFSARLDAERLREAVLAAIEAHPILRTHVVVENGVIAQSSETASVENIEVREVSEATLKQEITSFALPFNLAGAPLYRAQILKTSERIAFFFDAHHLVFDGFSTGVFLQDIRRFYEEGTPPAPEQAAFVYALNEQALLKSGEAEQHKAYYRRLFEEYSEATQVPNDIEDNSEEGLLAVCSHPFDNETIAAYCRQNSITQARFFAGAVLYVLSRSVHADNVRISMINAGRESEDVRGALGMYVQTMPLAVIIPEQATVSDYLRMVSDATAEAVAHAHYPALYAGEGIDLSSSVNFAYQIGISEKQTLGGFAYTQEFLGEQLPKFPLSIHIDYVEGAPSVAVEYNDARYSAEAMASLARSISVAALNMTTEENLRAVSLLDTEQRALVHRFGKVDAAPYDEYAQLVLHELFERQVDARPSHCALSACDDTMSYAELEALANTAAHALRARGFKPRDRACLLLPRTSRAIVALLAVLKAGGTYIPCDPLYPEERIRHIISDSAATFVITTSAQQASYGETALDIEELLQAKDAAQTERLLPSSTPQDAAYLIYTSGSTGTPKGVVVPHRAIVNHMLPHPENRHFYAMREASRIFLSVTTLSFDMSLKEVMFSLCNGLTLVLANNEEAKDPIKLTQLFERSKADAFNATPSRMTSYLSYAPFRQALAQCSVVICGAEKLKPALLSALKEATKARIFNTYGPTETTVSCNAKELTHEEFIQVGAPLLGAHEYIVDADGNELPPYFRGELLVGGKGLASEYRNNPAKTAEAFVTFQGERVFKTGDLASWVVEKQRLDASAKPNGGVVIHGRIDSQVKIRGLRVELGEIEAVLLAHPALTQAAVVVRTLAGENSLCAYYVAHEQVSEEDLMRFAARKLPDYMIPVSFNALDSFPITPNGKVDLRALPAPRLSATSLYEAPDGELEQALATIFSQVLQVPEDAPLGRNDSFFERGGSSLSATNVVIEADGRGLALSYAELFSLQTPRALALALAEKQEAEAAASAENHPTAKHVASAGESTEYDRIHTLLAENTLEAYKAGEKRPLGQVLLTGATGFLGIHVLHDFLENQTGKVWCLVRKGRTSSAEKRLLASLYYYFEESYEALLNTRLFVVEGDVAELSWMQQLEGKDISTVINCAAYVKHFSQSAVIDAVNTGFVEQLITYCLQRHCRLIQVSTKSIAGNRINDYPAPHRVLTEQDLFFDQFLENQYIHSKFLAEKSILTACLEGLDAKIMRVGNLAPRSRDGEFQINFSTNGFMGRLRAYALIKGYPFSALGVSAEMSPIDETARAILALAQAPEACRVFHPYNNHSITLGDIVDQMKAGGFEIALVEDGLFSKLYHDAQKNPAYAGALTSILAYETRGSSKKVEFIQAANHYTTQVLYRENVRWSLTSKSYLDTFIQALRTLGFFDK